MVCRIQEDLSKRLRSERTSRQAIQKAFHRLNLHHHHLHQNIREEKQSSSKQKAEHVLCSYADARAGSNSSWDKNNVHCRKPCNL